MRWQNKAKVMKTCASLPMGDELYKRIQKIFGRLNSDPMKRLSAQIEMARWLINQNFKIEGKTFFEVGTGHKPIVPIGFFLCGADSVITVDLHRRLDKKLTKQALGWIVENRKQVEAMYHEVVDSSLLQQRLNLIERLWFTSLEKFFEAANIVYLAPCDAAATKLPPNSIDYHFSVTTLEHIPRDMIRDIFIEANRILVDNGVAIHFIDLTDHFQHQDKSITTINFLRFTEQQWTRIAGNQFAYCNRLRVSDYLALFSELSFDPLHVDTTLDDKAKESLKNGFPIDKAFSSYSSEDICSTSLRIRLRPNGEKEF